MSPTANVPICSSQNAIVDDVKLNETTIGCLRTICSVHEEEFRGEVFSFSELSDSRGASALAIAS